MIFAVAWNRLLNLKHDRAAFVLAFVVPVAFFSVFAAIFGGTRSTTRRVPVVVVDEDASESSRRFVGALSAEKGLAVRSERPSEGRKVSVPYDRASAEAAVRRGDVPLALIVPKGFGARPIQLGPRGSGRPHLTVLADSADPIAPQLLTGLVQKVALEPAFGAGGSESAALVDVEVRDILGETKKNPTAALIAAGLGVMFLLFSAAGAGGALIEEAESGTLDRILSTRVSMTRLLVGKLVYLTGIAFAQLAVMFVWGEIFFGVELHKHVAGFCVISLVTALAASTFGLLLAAISRSRMQLVALSNLIILVMSALGGSMVPRYLLSEQIQKLGLLTLNAWAIDGFLKVFWRDEPLVNLWPQVTVLLLAAALLFTAARRLAKRWDVA